MLDRKKFKYYFQLALDVASGKITKRAVKDLFKNKADYNEFIRTYLDAVLIVRRAKPYLLSSDMLLLGDTLTDKDKQAIIFSATGSIVMLEKLYQDAKTELAKEYEDINLTDEDRAELKILNKQLDDSYNEKLKRYQS